MRLVAFNLGPLETNCFLLHDEKEAVLIDVGGDPGVVLAYLQKNKLTITDVLLTHLHFDHVLGAADLQAATRAVLHCSERDLFLLEPDRDSGMFPVARAFRHTDMDEGRFTLLGEECRALATPGHTPGGLSYYVPSLGALFGGDTLFYNSIGRTDFEGGDAAELARSIRGKIYTLPDETRVYPGHGPATTVMTEKRANPFVPAKG